MVGWGMPDHPTRRSLLRGLGALAVAATVPGVAGAETCDAGPAPPAPDHFPRQDPALVQRVVGASHRDLDEVRELVAARPELAKAQWDWGFGDWESALGAASHTGQREIALFLLAHGARPTLFSAAMLGQLEVVRAFVAAVPGIQATPGPHGIALLAHARAGGEPAAAVAAFLEEVGGADPELVNLALSAEEAARYAGPYRFGHGPLDELDVAAGRRGLTLARRGRSPGNLRHLGDGDFAPVGAASVRVRFEGAGELAQALVIEDGGPPLRALRIAAPAAR